MDMTKTWVWFVIGVVLGAGGGYYAGRVNGIKQGIEQERAAAAVVAASAGGSQAAANPLKNVKTNPYENIKTNPFQ